MNKIEKLIDVVHQLREEGIVSSPPTNITNNPQGPVNIAGLPPDNPPVFNGKKYAKGGKGSRRWWLQFLRKK